MFDFRPHGSAPSVSAPTRSGHIPREVARAAVRRALDLGVNFFHTSAAPFSPHLRRY
jgi:hypothetical protein